MTRTIVVLEYGWILCGILTGNGLEDAAVVRRWNNGRGIGGLAKAEYKNEYTLDPVGSVEINPDKVLYTITCEW